MMCRMRGRLLTVIFSSAILAQTVVPLTLAELFPDVIDQDARLSGHIIQCRSTYCSARLLQRQVLPKRRK